MNKKKHIDLLISNLSTYVLHKILQEAISDEGLIQYYEKELLNSLSVVQKIREKINPKEKKLSDEEYEFIAKKSSKKVNSEIKKRIVLGYQNLDISKIEIHIKSSFELINI